MNMDRNLIEREGHPFFDRNRLKLAVFGANVSHGCSMTCVDGTIKVDWGESVRVARAAEQAGFDAIIPVARWKGLGGEINFNHRCSLERLACGSRSSDSLTARAR